MPAKQSSSRLMRKQREAYVRARDADSQRSVYVASAPDRLPDCIDQPAGAGQPGEAVWTSAEVPVTSVYQVEGPNFSEWSRRWYIRALLAVVIACPLVLISWLTVRFLS